MNEQTRPGPVNPRELRVSDAERAHVVSVLQKAIGHGMLSLEEFTERTDTALAARTRGELNAVLVDLQGVRHPDGAGPMREEPVELRSNMSTLKRDGKWQVPQHMVITNRLGSTDLDFTEAVIDHAEVNIQLNVSGGSVKLLLPERASVNTNDVKVMAGSVKDKNKSGGSGTGYAGRPRFVLSGFVTAGSLTIRRASYVRIGSILIRSPWKLSWAND